MSLRPTLCSSIALPLGAVPDWLHLLPAGEITARDGRGPYHVDDVRALMAASTALGKLPIDENHAIDLASPKGGASPARGWIVELQQRADGIWGRVEWTATGRRIMEDKEYRGVSPVISHKADGKVTAIVRASLTNTPNLTGLTALHSQQAGEEIDDSDEYIIRAMGLDRVQYAQAKRAAAEQETLATQSSKPPQGDFDAAERHVARLLGHDQSTYATGRASDA